MASDADRTVVMVDGVRMADTELHIFNLTTAGGAGIASKFLTSDGLTKSGSNTFLYSSVIAGWSSANTIPALDERPISGGFRYNTSTGLAEWGVMESKTTGVLIGGSVEGLEVKENGFSVTCFVLAKL